MQWKYNCTAGLKCKPVKVKPFLYRSFGFGRGLDISVVVIYFQGKVDRLNIKKIVFKTVIVNNIDQPVDLFPVQRGDTELITDNKRWLVDRDEGLLRVRLGFCSHQRAYSIWKA